MVNYNPIYRLYNQLLININNFIQALESMSYYELYHFIPQIVSNFAIDYELIRFLRTHAEDQTLDYFNLFSILGASPLNIFRNNNNFINLNTIWGQSNDSR